MDRILVTGSNGLLGTNTVNALLKAGYSVRGILRKKQSYKGVQSLNLELFEGNFTKEEDFRNALSGCNAIIHCAACTGQGKSMDEYRKINVEATRQIFRIALDCGINRVVYISSSNIFGYGSKDNPGNESSAPRPPFTLAGYSMSKIEAQKVVDEFKGKLDIITICPTFMIGPFDSKPSSGRIIMMGYNKPMIFCPPGGKNFVPVCDVADAAVSALTNGVPGEAYLALGENLSYKEFYKILSEHTGGKGMLIKIPGWLLRFAGKAGDLFTRIFKITTEVDSLNMQMLCIENYFESDKAVKALGYSSRPVAQAVDEAVTWFRSNGMI